MDTGIFFLSQETRSSKAVCLGEYGTARFMLQPGRLLGAASLRLPWFGEPGSVARLLMLGLLHLSIDGYSGIIG